MTTSYTPQELEEALQYAEGIMEGIQVPFFLMDELGKFVFDHTADDWLDNSIDVISIGIRKLEVRDDVPRNLATIVKDLVVLPNEWQFSAKAFNNNSVPIRITILERKYGFLQNLDTRMHLSSEYKIPNPFNKYWQARYLVK